MECLYYKQYVGRQRRVEVSAGSLRAWSAEPPAGELRALVRALVHLPHDEQHVHAYYSRVKKLVCRFIRLWEDTMDEIVIEADALRHTLTKDKHIELIEKSIQQCNLNQITFAKEYLPVDGKSEKQMYEEIEEAHCKQITELENMRSQVLAIEPRYFPLAKVESDLQAVITNTFELFDMTHLYIALILCNNLPLLLHSVQHMERHLTRQLADMTCRFRERNSAMMTRLYDMGREEFAANKMPQGKNAEIIEGATLLRSRIEVAKREGRAAAARVRAERCRWAAARRGLRALEAAHQALSVRRAELRDKLTQYNDRLRDCNKPCLRNIGSTLKQISNEINTKAIENCKAIVTHFCIRGTSSALYPSAAGAFLEECGGHRLLQRKRGTYHTQRDGGLLEVDEDSNKEYLDEFGRFIKDEEIGKVYQRAACASSYRLGADGLLEQVAPDCEHYLRADPDVPEPCHQPDTRHLAPDAAAYLWHCLSGVLPAALADVAAARPPRPARYLAHRLLRRSAQPLQPPPDEARAAAELFAQELHRASRSWRERAGLRRGD